MDKKQYWENVARARKEIYDLMMEMGVSSVRNTDSINPFYNQIVDNGGIGLEFYYGLPAVLYTPLGKIGITISYTSGGDRDEILKRLTAEYGLVTIQEKKYIKGYGVDGPVYAITKLPWSDEILPVFEPKKYTEYIDYRVAKEMYSTICSELKSE